MHAPVHPGLTPPLPPFIQSAQYGQVDLGKVRRLFWTLVSLPHPRLHRCAPHTPAAQGHVKAVQYLQKRTAAGLGGVDVVNLGTGKPYSVLELVVAFSKASGRPIPYRVGPRRPGDIEAVWADASKAASLLGWHAELGLADSEC